MTAESTYLDALPRVTTAAQDAPVVGVLGDGFRAAVDGDRLTLTSDGALGLGYRASS